MLLRIRTFIRSERAATAALGVTTIALALVFASAVVAGDQRRIEVVLSSPGSGDDVPQTLQSLTITFSREPDREQLLQRFSIEPEADGTLRVRGRTAEFFFDAPLARGTFTALIEPGVIGRAGERLDSQVRIELEVRDPGIAYVRADDPGETIVAARGNEHREMVSAARIRSFAIAPSGLEMAVVTEGADRRTQLHIIDTTSLDRVTIVDDPEIDLGDVTWAPDGSALLVSRQDIFPDGTAGVERIWLLRVDGTFAGQVDREDNPSHAPAWAPNGQSLAYVSPATEEVIVLRLGTGEWLPVGIARGRGLAWSTDSRLVAFEAIPPGTGDAPLQPVFVVDEGGAMVLQVGEPNEIASQPRFIDETTLATLWREVGVDASGTELRFTSVTDGSLQRSFPLVTATDLVLSWVLDPLHEHVVYAVRTGADTRVVRLDLATGTSEVVAEDATQARWLP